VRLALIKLSSLGDLVHALPALTEAAAALPGLRCDWAVEQAFAAIPGWHPAVGRVIPVALRRWRSPGALEMLRDGTRALRAQRYDLVLDAQGLIKSAVLTRLARGRRAGFDRRSAREPLASLAYGQRIAVPRPLHAIERLRRLFAAALGYALAKEAPPYGLDPARFGRVVAREAVVFLHGTAWHSKRWPLGHWQALAVHAARAGLEVLLPWGSPAERRDAQIIATATPAARVLPALGLTEIAGVIAGARAVVGGDTGLAHLAVALGRPTVTVYGASDPALTGTWGQGQARLAVDFPCAPCLARRCALVGQGDDPPCYGTLPPAAVWAALDACLAA
jgi:heptosyltransferase I